MGFSTSGAVAILFAGLLIAVGMAYPVVQTANDDRRTAIDDRDDRTLDMHNTDIVLKNASYSGTEDTLTVNVTNTGSTTLSVPATDLLVDGSYRELTANETTVEGSASRELWQPGELLTITVTATTQPDRVKVVTEHGIAETTTEV